MKSTYEHGLDVLGGGVGLGDFIPWLGLASKVVGGFLGGGSDSSSDDKAKTSAAVAAVQKKAAAAQKKAEEEQKKAEEARKKAEEAAAKARMTLYLVLGGVGFVTMGGVLYIALRKK